MLIAIFFSHFAHTGCIYALHGLDKHVLKPVAFSSNYRAVALSVLLAFAISPIVIPMVLIVATIQLILGTS